jgi:hypothetical protein
MILRPTYDTLLTVSALLSILVGLFLTIAAFFVAKGYGMQYEGWMIRTIFRRDPEAGWIGQWRSRGFYRFWQMRVGTTVLAFMGIYAIVGGIVRLFQGA